MNVIRGVMFFKHEAYRNENEYRFQQLFRRDKPAPDVKYRRRPTSLVRYREYGWRRRGPGALKKIVIGPAADRDKAARFVKDCLASFHPEPDSVDPLSPYPEPFCPDCISAKAKASRETRSRTPVKARRGQQSRWCAALEEND
jgi:hypothetical protein